MSKPASATKRLLSVDHGLTSLPQKLTRLLIHTYNMHPVLEGVINNDGPNCAYYAGNFMVDKTVTQNQLTTPIYNVVRQPRTKTTNAYSRTFNLAADWLVKMQPKLFPHKHTYNPYMYAVHADKKDIRHKGSKNSAI